MTRALGWLAALGLLAGLLAGFGYAPREAVQGNVQRIIVKDEHGNTFVEIPVTVAAIGAVAAPVLAALGAISALVAKFSIVVVRTEPKPPAGT